MSLIVKLCATGTHQLHGSALFALGGLHKAGDPTETPWGPSWRWAAPSPKLCGKDYDFHRNSDEERKTKVKVLRECLGCFLLFFFFLAKS